MIVRARVVVTMTGPPIENGAVAISGTKIIDVGKFSEVSRRRSGEEVVDLGDQAVLPGLVNAHCHLDYTCLRGKIPRPKSFTDWIRAINAAKAKLSGADYVASIRAGFAEAQRFGTTTVANLTAFPELIAQIREPIRTWWFGEFIDVRNPGRAVEIVDLAVGSLKSKGNWGLAPHSLFTASPNLFRRCEEIARHENILLTTHLAESSEEFSMFHEASGPLYEFMKEIGRGMSDCGRGTPLATFVGALGPPPPWTRSGVTSEHALPNWILTHLNELSESDFDCLAARTKVTSTSFAIVHCPRSGNYFGHSPFQFEKFRKRGFNICLGTDSLATNSDLSLFAEMREFQRNFPAVSPEETFAMVTKNPARALAQQSLLGEVKRGAFADLIAVPAEAGRNIFEKITGFSETVSWSMIDGAVQKAG
jgi:aminodeoxyfutalosine deaminase